MSLNIDSLWRKRVLQELPQHHGLRILDLATGTGDLLFLLAKQSNVNQAIGIDLSKNMLALAKKKSKNLPCCNKVQLQVEDAMKLSTADNTFDFCSISFGIRNMSDPVKCLKEIFRVLKKGGTLCVIELSIPINPFLRYPYIMYFRYVLPFIGNLISGDPFAYRYLNQTVEAFPQREAFCKLLHKAGFKKGSYSSLTFGIATLYSAIK